MYRQYSRSVSEPSIVRDGMFHVKVLLPVTEPGCLADVLGREHCPDGGETSRRWVDEAGHRALIASGRLSLRRYAKDGLASVTARERQQAAKSGHRMPTKLVAIQYFGTAKVFLTISTDPANYLSRLAARHRAYGSRPIIR